MVGSKLYVTVIAEDLEEATSDETAPVTMFEELELEAVESAGRINRQANILVAYFSSEMDEINPADIEIRRVSDNRLFTVEKVTMTSDGLTATMTLTGTAAAAAGTEYLTSNVPYRMIVKNGDKTLEKEFIIPNVLDNAVVTAVDPDNAKISLNGQEYELGEGVTVDNYFELLGKTVTAEADETGKITEYNVAKLKSVTGKFKYTAGTATAPATYKEVVSGTVYKTTLTNPNNASTYMTETVKYNDKFAAAADPIYGGGADVTVPNTDLEWGRLVFNPDGTIRTVMGLATLPNSAYVTANDDGVIKNGASVKVNVKDFVIIDGAITIDPEDLEEGDVFIYNAADQVGYVYNNAIEGTFTKNYGTKYVFADKEYSAAPTTLKDQKEANLTTSAVDDLITAKTEMTLYTNIAGEGVYAIGEAAALTSTVKLFVTSTGTSGTEDLNSMSVTGFNPATEALETYTWTGDKGVTSGAVAGWTAGPNNTEVPVLVKITVNAEDGTTVKKVEEVAEAFDVIATGPAFLDGIDTANDTTAKTKIDEIKKSTKLIGSDADNGMDTAKAKVVVYKNPAKATDAWKASNFTVYNYSDWTGKLVESAVNSGLFLGTHIYGTLSKSVDFLFVEGKTDQPSAGAVGIEAGTPFVGFVTESLDGTSKRVKAITAEGEQTYETFLEENKAASLTASVVGTFVVITPSKTFDDDETIYKIETLGTAKTYSQVTVGYAAEASNGATLTTCNNTATTYKEFDIASDVLVIKKTVKDGTTSYAASTATAIKQYAPVSVYKATGNNTIAKMVLFAEPDTGLTAVEAGAAVNALSDGDKTTITNANDARATEKAAIDAITATIANSVTTTTATVTLTDPNTYGGTNALTAVTNTNGKTAGTVAFDTPKLVATYTANAEGNGAVDAFGITLTGTYYVRTISYSATVDNGAATHTTTLAKLDDTTVLK